MASAFALTPTPNVYVPISCLPSELCLRIFLFVRSADNRCGLRWIAVSQVCHQWRSLALSYPILWNHIDLSYPDRWTSEMLRRSQSASLTVSADLTMESIHASLRHFHSRIGILSRIIATRDVCVDIHVELPRIYDNVASKVITMSAPFLQSISLVVPEIDRPRVALLPTTFLGGQTLPLLYQLKLVDVEFTLPCACPNLKQLEIRRIRGHTSCTLNDLITFLQQTPLLTDLVLHNSLSSQVITSYLGNPVELPRLRAFRLGNNLDILAHLVLPFNTALALHVYSSQGEHLFLGREPFDEEFVLVAKRLNGEHNNEKDSMHSYWEEYLRWLHFAGLARRGHWIATCTSIRDIC
jgi:hypothetical protein